MDVCDVHPMAVAVRIAEGRRFTTPEAVRTLKQDRAGHRQLPELADVVHVEVQYVCLVVGKRGSLHSTCSSSL